MLGLAGDVRVVATPAAVADAAADRVARLCARNVADHGRFTIALSGGATPRRLYETLASAPWLDTIDWPSWHVYFGDERACPPEDYASNYHLARVTLLDQVPIDAENVHRMLAERDDLDEAANEYAALLERTLPRGPMSAPRLDCILLGIGTNGHVASLFPETPALEVTDRWAVRGRADYPPFDRITLTFPTINAARSVIFVVTGDAKRDALRATAAGSVPAARVQPADGTVTWFMDSAALA